MNHNPMSWKSILAALILCSSFIAAAQDSNSQRTVPTTAPTIRYAKTRYEFSFSTTVSIIPSLSGQIDSITLSPDTLPLGLFFDTLTGTISGSTLNQLSEDTYIITAYNSAGTFSDTITIAVSLVVPIENNDIFTQARYVALLGASGSNFYFSIPKENSLENMELRLINLNGQVVWKKNIPGTMLGFSKQTVTITSGIGNGMYLMEIRSKQKGLERVDVQRRKISIIQ